MNPMDGNAIVYCEGAFRTANGKTAHGLVRFTRRYRVLSVVDSTCAGRDAAELLDGTAKGIPVHASLDAAFDAAKAAGAPATHFVVGLAPDGGRLAGADREVVKSAIGKGLHVDAGLHDFLSEDPEINAATAKNNVLLRDVRKPPHRNHLHFFSGKIDQVESFTVAVLGTDSAVGKRTTAWLLVQAFEAAGFSAEMIGTGQTAWMQGARYSLIMDSLVNDFVSGEIEHAVWSAWNDRKPDVIVIEGQGSLMNPAYPGGFEILAAGRPDVVVLQHVPGRAEYDGFPGYPIQPLSHQIEAITSISGRPVVAVTLNHENLDAAEIPVICRTIRADVGVPAFDVLKDGAGAIVDLLKGLWAHKAAGRSISV